MDGMLGLSGDSEIFKYFTFDEALKSAKEKTFLNRPKEYTVLEATHHFKADVNVVETVLSGQTINFFEKNELVKLGVLEEKTDLNAEEHELTLAQPETPKQEFKVGDHVIQDKCLNSIYRINRIDKNWVSMTPIYGGIVGTIFESQCSIERLSRFKMVILD
jgi:hypothetical protein